MSLPLAVWWLVLPRPEPAAPAMIPAAVPVAFLARAFLESSGLAATTSGIALGLSLMAATGIGIVFVPFGVIGSVTELRRGGQVASRAAAHVVGVLIPIVLMLALESFVPIAATPLVVL